MSDTTRDIFTILGKVFNEGRRYELPEAWSYDLDKCMSPREAEKAINEYIAQQVKEATINGLIMAKYGTDEDSKEERFIDNLIRQEQK